MKSIVFALFFVALVVLAQGAPQQPEDAPARLADSAISIRALKDISPNPIPRACISSSCNNLCLVYGYLGGVCYSGECWCVYV